MYHDIKILLIFAHAQTKTTLIPEAMKLSIITGDTEEVFVG